VVGNEFVLHVWGDFACFTRPELKVERYSYPFITPSAARGVFDAILCKPARDPTEAQFRWQVTRIEVLSPPSYIALRRNEVHQDLPALRTIERWMDGRDQPSPLLADEMGKGCLRTQRQTMALRDVRYRLHARIIPWPRHADRLHCFEAQFIRRAAAGKCFYQPYLGCREFPGFFEPVAPDAPGPPPCSWDTDDLGLMLYDVFDLSGPGGPTAPPSVSLFRPVVRGGVVEVPPYESPDVLKPRGAMARDT